jgi:hypothetical protein
MPANPIRGLTFDESILNQLACPACYRELRHEETGLVCRTCGRTYPIIEGIPVLIADRAQLNQS